MSAFGQIANAATATLASFNWQSFGETVTMLGGIIAAVYKIALVPLRERVDALEDRLEDIAGAMGITPRPRVARRRKDGRR